MRMRCSSSLAALLLASQIAVIGGGSIADGSSSRSSIMEYNALFVFGDSIADTGNICIVARSNSTAVLDLEALTLTHPPYGMTYFGRPSCRGRIVVDFIAQALGLPLLAPSKSKGRDFARGANMAITGGTALNFSFYKALGIEDPVWDLGSLSTQIRWFEELVPSICGTRQECKGFLEKSLFLFGGFGGNDYNIQLLELALTPDQAAKSTPKIVDAIAHGVERLIALGAVHVVVPGILPTGCLPLFLSLFAGGSSSSSSSTQAAEAADIVDEYGCLRSYNNLTEYHNALLRERVRALRRKHRASAAARIMYADLAEAYFQMVKQPQKFGLSDNPLEACCGAGGGKYNFDITARCGMPGATTACHDPSARLSWDGVHPTEAADRVIAETWHKGPYCTPPILF